MEFFRRAGGAPSSVGILPGGFNPPTRAHLALAMAALAAVDEVVWVLPRAFPHKDYAGAGFEQRLAMLRATLADEPFCSIAASAAGLFIDIARECRTVYGSEVRLLVLCGRDAAERVVNWDYGQAGAFARMLDEFELLVGTRQGPYLPPPELRPRVHSLPLCRDYDDISSTGVRERIARGEPWEHLVPPSVAPLAREIYLNAL